MPVTYSITISKTQID